MTSEDLPRQTPGPGQKRQTCLLCQQRKVKCDRNQPCKNCVKAGVDCVPISSLPSRKRKPRFSEAELLARLRRYEYHLRRYGADIDAINAETRLGSPTNDQNISYLALSQFNNKSNFTPGNASLSPKHTDEESSSASANTYQDNEAYSPASSDDEAFTTSLGRTYDELNDAGEDLLIGSSVIENLDSRHPTLVQIFRLWQTFLDNVNPLIKLFHAPSVQQTVLDATTDPASSPKSTQALLFGIYGTATMSMSDVQCQQLFNKTKQEVLARFKAAARQALRNAAYTRSSDLVVLQAYILYLLSCLQKTVDPRSLLCLTGVAVRIAQRMGLSSDSINQKVSPFESEMRRRLWWQIVLLDVRIAELSGADSSVLDYSWTTQLPSNVNDSDLSPEMTEPPSGRSSLTEMLFVRLRCEEILLQQQFRSSAKDSGTKRRAVEQYEMRLEHDYLRFCDPAIPSHIMATIVARSSFVRLRMEIERPDLAASSRTKYLSSAQKETLFQLLLKNIQLHNVRMKNPSIRCFLWHTYSHSPFVAHVHLLSALRYRPVDRYTDQAWQEVSDSADMRVERMLHDDSHADSVQKPNLVFEALKDISIKAWETRENAARANGQVLVVPGFISKYKEMQSMEQRQTLDHTLANGTTPPIPMGSLSLEQQTAPQFPMSSTNLLSFGTGQNFDAGMIPGMLSNVLQPNDWSLWNDMMLWENPEQDLTMTELEPHQYDVGPA